MNVWNGSQFCNAKGAVSVGMDGRTEYGMKRWAERARLLIITSTFPRHLEDKEPPFVFELSRRLAKTFRVTILAPHAPGSKSLERMAGMVVVRYRYDIERWEQLAYDGGILAKLKHKPWLYLRVPLFLLGQGLAVWQLAQRLTFTVIHAHWVIPQGLMAVLATRLLTYKPALLVTCHGGDLFGLKGRFLTGIKRWVLHRADAVTVVSEAMQHTVIQELGICKEKVSIIPMGVDTQCVFTPPDQSRNRDPYTLLFVGRLVEKKGVLYLLEALVDVIQQYPACRLLIAGAGPDEPALQQQVHLLGIQERVIFLGNMKQCYLAELYRWATICIVPSIVAEGGDQEGLGLVLVEAMACECPVIASDLPAIRDAVIPGITGMLVPQKNSKALAGAIVELLANPQRRQDLSFQGQGHVRRFFDWKSISRRYATLLNDCSSRH